MNSEPTVSRGFRRLTLAAAIAVYVLIIAGGVVRITESGLGCPDWPLCYGQAIPPLEMTAIIEYTHRSIAAIGGLLVLLVAAIAWWRYRGDARLVIPASAVIALLAIQIPLGAWIVATELNIIAVAFHLGMALIIFGCALLTTVAAYTPAQQAARVSPLGYRMLLISTLAMVFLLMITGALVVGGGASHLCDGWPLCDGRFVLLPQANPGLAIQLLHRYTVFVVSFLMLAVTAATLQLRDSVPGARTWALGLGGLFLGQVAVGAIQVLTGMPALWRSVHLALAAGVWASLVVLLALTFLGSRAAVPVRAKSRRAPLASASK